MQLVTVIWSMVASACLTLAIIHLLIWCQKREAWANLLFTIMAAGTAGIAACELWMLRAETIGQFASALRWFHVPVWVVIVSLVGFVRAYLRAGRLWLAWSICGLRTVSVLLNFVTGQNLNYLEVTGLRHLPLLGDSVSVAEGVANPWMLVGQLSLLLFLAFVVDATLTVWRRGDRRLAAVAGGSLVFFVLAGTAQAVVVLWHIVQAPMTVSLFFLAVIAAMGYEMSREALRAAQLSDELRESEARLKLAAEAAGFGVWMWNIARNRIWASDRWLSLFEFASGQTVTFERVLERIHPDDRAAMQHAVRHAIRAAADYTAEYRVVLPDSRCRWVVAHGRVYADANGAPTRMLGATIDITDRKRSEMEIERQRSELMHLSRVAMLGELSGSLAHELNQPLTAILSNAEAARMFLDGNAPDLAEIRSILDDIVSADKRAGEIIQRLRSLLKKEVVRHQPLEINEILQEVLKLVRSALVRHEVTVEASLADGLPGIAGDRVQLQQLLINLIVNACDAMAGNPANDRRLVVRTDAHDSAVRLAIIDNGSGIPVDMLERIFDSFVTTKRSGLGLGLSICRGIIAEHQGRISAENNPDRGACFRVILPAVPGT